MTLATTTVPYSFPGWSHPTFPALLLSPDPKLESSVILVVATVLTAECRRFWQLLLCQGLLIGICCGMIFSPIPVVISQWFEKRRSFVIGTTSAGAALGGITIPIAARNLINLVGYANISHGYDCHDLRVSRGSSGQCASLL